MPCFMHVYIACLYGNNENEFIYRCLERDRMEEEELIDQEKEEGLQYVKKNHLEYFFGFINNCAFSSHEKSQPRNFVKLSLNKKAFRHEGEKMVFGAFYDPFVQEANRQLREIVIQRRYINESILFDFQQFLFNSLNNLCIRTLIYEMHICGQEGVLRGNESEQYQYYIDHFLKDKQYLNDLFSLYPVLERRINEIIQNAIDIYKEVIERIEELSRYYQRIGIILFINYLLEGGDIHFENLIACNEYPVIIDAEVHIIRFVEK